MIIPIGKKYKSENFFLKQKDFVKCVFDTPVPILSNHNLNLEIKPTVFLNLVTILSMCQFSTRDRCQLNCLSI